MRLAGKKALITGGGGGMGRAMVKAFSAEGAEIFTNDIAQAGLDGTMSELAPGSAPVHAGLYDLATVDGVQQLAADAEKALGQVDIIVNNAGIFDYLVPTADMPLETWDRLFFVNVTSHFLLAQRLLPAMATRGTGAVISIASAAGLVGGGGGAAYTASKHAALGLMKQLAFEFGPQGVRVNAICPGIVRTPLLESALAGGGEEWLDSFSGMTASRRVGRPEEIASAALFLASDEASFMFGSVVSVDGGYTLF